MFRLKPLLALFLLSPVLTGCQLLSRGPGESGLNIGTVYLRGELEQQIELQANGFWELTENSSWLRVSRYSGFGNTNVILSVDPDGLVPGEYVTTVTMSHPEAEPEHMTVVFAFPKLRGSIVLGAAPASDPALLSLEMVPPGPGRLLVGLSDPARLGPPASRARGLEGLAAEIASSRAGMRLARTLPSAKAAVLDVQDMRSAVAALRGDQRVRYVERDLLMRPLTTDTLWPEQWAVRRVNADRAWSTGDGTGVRIGIIDGGLHPNHRDLVGNVLEYRDFVAEQDSDCGTHGTHVAGIAAAETNNLEGVAGVAPGAKLVLINAGFVSAGACVLSVSAVTEAIDWIVDNSKADVINMSFGTLSSSQTLHEAVQRAYAAGITLVAAAGNSSNEPVLYPAAFPQVIAVSATNVYDQSASYSANGPEVFLSAPGGDAWDAIWSTAQVNGDDGYAEMVGTSMASPAVAAAAAIVLSVDPALSPLQVAGLLADTSVDLGASGRDESFGYGLIDAEAAALAAANSSGEPNWFIFRSDGAEFPVRRPEQFTSGYVGVGDLLEVGSDDDWDGTLRESGEYYDSVTVRDPFGDEYFDVVFYVETQP